MFANIFRIWLQSARTFFLPHILCLVFPLQFYVIEFFFVKTFLFSHTFVLTNFFFKKKHEFLITRLLEMPVKTF